MTSAARIAAVAGVLLFVASCGSSGPTSVDSPPGPGRSTATFASGPAPTTSTAHLGDPIGVAIDSDGNVWVGDYRNSTLQEYRAGDVAAATGETRPEPALMVSEVGGP